MGKMHTVYVPSDWALLEKRGNDVTAVRRYQVEEKKGAETKERYMPWASGREHVRTYQYDADGAVVIINSHRYRLGCTVADSGKPDPRPKPCDWFYGKYARAVTGRSAAALAAADEAVRLAMEVRDNLRREIFDDAEPLDAEAARRFINATNKPKNRRKPEPKGKADPALATAKKARRRKPSPDLTSARRLVGIKWVLVPYANGKTQVAVVVGHSKNGRDALVYKWLDSSGRFTKNPCRVPVQKCKTVAISDERYRRAGLAWQSFRNV